MNLKKIFFNFLYVAMIVALIGFMIYLVFWLRGTSRYCLEDPINYFMEKNEGAECSCIKDGIEWPETSKIEEQGSVRVEVNYTEIENYLKDE